MIVALNLHDTHGICITWVDLLVGRGQHSCGTVRFVRRRWMRSTQGCLMAGRMRRLQRSTPRSTLHANGTSCATGMAPFTSAWCLTPYQDKSWSSAEQSLHRLSAFNSRAGSACQQLKESRVAASARA